MHTWLGTQTEGWWRYAFDTLGLPSDYISTQAVASQPDLRQNADARFEGCKEDTGDRTIILRLWNTGRHPVKVQFHGLTIKHGDEGETDLPVYWHGPDLPIWIPGYSGEQWWGEIPDLPGQLMGPLDSNEVSVESCWRRAIVDAKSKFRHLSCAAQSRIQE